MEDTKHSILNTQQYCTKYKEVNGNQTVTILNNQSVFHAITGLDMFNIIAIPLKEQNEVYTFKDRYSEKIF